jgi:O-antigen ligase
MITNAPPLQVRLKKSLLAVPPVMLVALALWLLLSALVLPEVIDHPSKRALAVFGALFLTPLLILKADRIPIYLLAAYAAALPLSNLGHGQSVTFMKVLGVASAACLLLSMVLKRTMAPPSRTLFAVSVLMVYAGATILWAIDSAFAFKMYLMYLSYAGLFAVCSLYPFSRRDANIVLGGTVVGALAAGAYGAYMYRHGLQIGTQLRLRIGYEGADYSQTIDPNVLAATLLIPIAILLVLSFRLRFGPATLAAVAALFVLLAAFAVSASRGATIGLGVMWLYLLWRSKYRIPLIIAVAAAAAAMVASPLGHRFTQDDWQSADGRFDIWKVAFASLHQYWLAGAGIGNFPLAFQQYYLSVPHMPVDWNRVAHNVLIQSAVEYGVIGVVLIVVLWYFAFRELAQVRSKGIYSDLCVALRASILGLFVSGLSLDLMTQKCTWLAFILVTMMRNALLQSHTAEHPAENLGDSSPAVVVADEPARSSAEAPALGTVAQ